MHPYIIDDVHPPLYFYVTKFFFLIFGVSEFSLRLPAVIFGLLGVIAFFIFTRRFFGIIPAYIGTSLLAISGFHIAYSLMARMYSLLFFLVVLAMYFFYSMLEKWNSSDFYYLVLSMVLLFYTHIFAFFFFLFVMFVLALYNWRKALIFAGIVGSLSIPIFMFYVYQVYRKITGESHANWMYHIDSSPIEIYYVFSAMSSSYVLSVPFILIFFLFIFLYYKKFKLFNFHFLLLLQVCITISIPLIFHFFVEPMYALRYFMIAYPAFLLCIILSLSYLIKFNRILAVLLITLIFFFTLFATGIYETQRLQINSQSKACAIEYDELLEMQKNSSFFVTRWLNDWHPNQRITDHAFKFYSTRFNTNLSFVNSFNTQFLVNESYVVIISPMIRNQFINDSNLVLVQERSCRFTGFGHNYGYDYRKYRVVPPKGTI